MLLLGLIGLALLCLLCPYCRAPAIEEDLQRKALVCVNDAGLDAEVLSISGRDISLSGIGASRAVNADVEACIAAIPGIRVVDNQLQGLGTLVFETRYGSVTLRGAVPTEAARTNLVDAAVSLWGAEHVVDQLQVHPDDHFGPWPSSFASGLAALHHYRQDLEVEISEDQVVVTGSVVSELTRGRVLGGTATNLPGLRVIDHLTIRQPVGDHEILQANLDFLLAGKVVEFATDGADLTKAGKAVLNEVIGIMKTNPGRIEISGHTDSRQTPEYNLELSRRRAVSVESYFIAKGLDADRYETIGLGESRPIAPNDTAEGQQKNRRTEFHALKEN